MGFGGNPQLPPPPPSAGPFYLGQSDVPWDYADRLRGCAYPHTPQFWWNGQAAAYLMRFNARLAGNVSAYLARRGPLPPGSISSHVRTELAKGREMPLVPFPGFIDAMVRLAGTPVHPACGPPCGLLARSAFVSTEDPYVAGAAIARDGALVAGGWAVSVLPIRRLPQTSMELGGPALNTATWGGSVEVVQSMWNLAYAIACDAWVGTLGSNWNRLINEMRGTWLRKADQVRRGAVVYRARIS